MGDLEALVWIAGIVISILLCVQYKRKQEAEQFRKDNDSYNTCKRDEKYRIKNYKWR